MEEELFMIKTLLRLFSAVWLQPIPDAFFFFVSFLSLCFCLCLSVSVCLYRCIYVCLSACLPASLFNTCMIHETIKQVQPKGRSFLPLFWSETYVPVNNPKG